jgi:hypothetical protein
MTRRGHWSGWAAGRGVWAVGLVSQVWGGVATRDGSVVVSPGLWGQGWSGATTWRGPAVMVCGCGESGGCGRCPCPLPGFLLRGLLFLVRNPVVMDGSCGAGSVGVVDSVESRGSARLPPISDWWAVRALLL